MDMDDPLDFEFEDQLISSSLVTKKRFYSPTSISFLSFTIYPFMVLCIIIIIIFFFWVSYYETVSG